MEIIVVHEMEQSRFVTRIDGHEAELIYEKDEVNRIFSFTHTLVPKSLEGRGIGRALILESIQYMRANSYKMMPVCPFVIAYAKKNIKDLQDLLPQDFTREREEP